MPRLDSSELYRSEAVEMHPSPGLLGSGGAIHRMTAERSDVIPLGAHMSLTVVDFEVDDIRFPTSEQLDGSDAMNPDPDYSAAYVVLRTDGTDGPGGTGEEGHGFCFTIGRGNDVMAAAIETLRSYVVGRPVPRDAADLAALYRTLTHDSQLRWLGPEKGVMHMAAGAVVNAAWDLAAKLAGKPVWQFLGEMTPEELVSLVDFRYLTDALTPQEALDILRAAEPGRAERTERLLAEGYPAYTTSPGWLGYDDDKLVRLAKEAVADGFTQIKLKVGADLDDDIHAARGRPSGGRPRHPDRRRRQPALGRGRRGGVDEGTRPVRPVLDRGADQPRRRTRPRRRACRAAGQGRHRRTHRQQGRLQAAAPGRCGRLRPDRRRARRRGQREPGGPAARGQVRSPGLPPRRWRRTVRAGPAPLDVRLRRGVRQPGGPCHRVRRPPPRALRRPRRDRGRPLRHPRAPGFSARMLPASIAGHRYPQGHVWQARRTPEETGR